MVLSALFPFSAKPARRDRLGWSLMGVLGAVWLLGVSSVAQAETYDVGPGHLATIGEVPWASLMPGDVVRIHYRAEPYREKWVIGVRGREDAPIVVQGIPGPEGQRPVIDGANAVTAPGLRYWNEVRGVIKIGGSSQPPDTLPAWIVVENLEIRSARPAYSFEAANGETEPYARNAAAMYIEKGEHIVLRNNVFTDSGNGLFIGASDGMTQDILIEANHFYDNGIEGRVFEHNAYTAAIGIVYQYNHFGPLRDGCRGNNLKDRSAGLVVRYNWIESGNRQLDLVDAEDSRVLVEHPSYGDTYVYGNVLVEHEGDGNAQIVHYGGDSGTTGDYRKGTLHFFHNTLVSTRPGNTTLMRLSTDDEQADVFANVLYADGALAMVGESGTMALHDNWVRSGWRASFDGEPGTVNDDGSNAEGEAPAFVDRAGQDFTPAAGSPLLDQAPDDEAVLATHPVVMQYGRHQGRLMRPVDGRLDLGAIEACLSAGCMAGDAGVMDAGVRDGGTTDGGVMDGGVSVDASSTMDGSPADGSSADAGPTSDDGGCGCRAGTGGDRGAWAVLLLGLVMIRRRRLR